MAKRLNLRLSILNKDQEDGKGIRIKEVKMETGTHSCFSFFFFILKKNYMEKMHTEEINSTFKPQIRYILCRSSKGPNQKIEKER